MLSTNFFFQISVLLHAAQCVAFSPPSSPCHTIVMKDSSFEYAQFGQRHQDRDYHYNFQRRRRTSLNSNISDRETLSRREAFLATAAMASALMAQCNPSSATELQSKTPSLEELNIGSGAWLGPHEARFTKNAASIQSSIIPPNFATYATRFLIKYDQGAKQWWDDVKNTNSLLPSNEERNKLGNAFGSLARSIQLSLESFILSDSCLASSSQTDKSAIVRSRYEDLFRVFYSAYGRIDDSAMRHLGLLFSTLPAKYQPVQGLKDKIPIMYEDVADLPISTSKLSVAFTEELTDLLPPKYATRYDSASKSYVIQPSFALYEIGVNNELGEDAIATVFGPLSETQLKRQKPDLSIGVYSLLGGTGALACALTHSAVIPFDVVKTRLQTDPDRYSNILEGTMNIAKDEGARGFTLGAEATVAGYFWYGLSVYPSYTFFKWFLSNVVVSPALATANANVISLAAGAIAAVIASLGLTPLEACRIRAVAEPEVYGDIGLVGTMQAIAREDEVLTWKTLYAGLPSLMIRQVVFGSIKFLAFERACEFFFIAAPFLRDSTSTALGVTIVAGALSGALSSVVSQPADSILTYIAKNKNDGDSFGLSTVVTMVEDDGIGSLYRGLGSRCIWAAAIISGQFFLYDIFRNALGINNDDLSQVFEFVVNSVIDK